MGAIKVVDRPTAYPGRTIYGKTIGPCAYLGQVIEGVHVFANESESREILHAWKWPTPEAYTELEEHAKAIEKRVAVLEAELEEALAQVVQVVPVEDVLVSLALRS